MQHDWRVLGERDSFGLLLVLLIGLFLLVSLTPPGGTTIPKAVVAMATLVLALNASKASVRVLVVVGVLSLAIIVISIVEAFVVSNALRASLAFIFATIMLVTAITILNRIFRHRRITVSTVLGAVCVYLLIGIMFAFVFQGLDDIESTSIFSQDPSPQASDYSYFSFVTLTTLGYGDLTPTGDVARTFAVFEAMLGQIYLVTIVGLLVGNLGRTRDDLPTPQRSKTGRSLLRRREE